MKLTTRCGQAAVAGLNEALWAKAAGDKLLRTARVRADTTVISANVAYPTDSGLLARAVGKLMRTARRVQAAGGATGIRADDRPQAGRRPAGAPGALPSQPPCPDLSPKPFQAEGAQGLNCQDSHSWRLPGVSW